MPPGASGFPGQVKEAALADGSDGRIMGATGFELDGHVQGIGQGFEGGHPQIAPGLGLGQAHLTDPRPRRQFFLRKPLRFCLGKQVFQLSSYAID